VVGFDGIALGALARVGLTTVAQPLAEMARVGVELLLGRVARPDRAPRTVLLEPELVVRATTAQLIRP
jgi:LacI family transcriptional regulator